MADPMSNPAIPERTGDYSETPSTPYSDNDLAKRLKPYVDNPYLAPSHKLVTEVYNRLVGR